jgi:hypothetical protein
MKKPLLLLGLLPILAQAASIETDLLIVGADESGCAAAIQAARLGVKRIILTNDIDWLGGQFATQGIGPMDEWTPVNGKRVNFPRSGQFSEIIQAIRAHNLQTYGVATPGNSWCGTETIEPKAGAEIFEARLAPYTEKGTGQIQILRSWEPSSVQRTQNQVTGVRFVRPHSTSATDETLEVRAKLTVDSSDWGDVIRLSGASYMAGPDTQARFGEPSAPQKMESDTALEMNPLTWCVFLREAGKDATIPKPARYDERSFSGMKNTPLWKDWDGSGGIYNFAGWCVYTHRRIIDRTHFSLQPGTEAVVLNWPVHDYPLCNLPKHVVDALEQSEPGASRKNIVHLNPAQRWIIFEDAKQHSLQFLYYLQTTAHDRSGDFPHSFRYMKLADDYGTPDHLPPKPYIREGLRLEALTILKEQDIRTEGETPLWAKVMVPDGVVGFQFDMDFHPTRRKFENDDSSQPWVGKHFGTRNWHTHTDRAMLPLRSLIPVKMDGLLGASKNIGLTSMVQSAFRLHGQMTHVGSAVGTLAALALEEGKQPREIAGSMKSVREVQKRLLRGARGPGTLLWPWHDVSPEDSFFEASNLLTLAGIWQPERNSVYFSPNKAVTRRELATTLARLYRALPDAPEWPEYPAAPLFRDLPTTDPDRSLIEALFLWGDFGKQDALFKPDDGVTWSQLNGWFKALKLPEFPSLLGKAANSQLTRSECVDFIYRALQKRGEWFPQDGSWLQPGGDDDGDGIPDFKDPLPLDRDNNNVPDRVQAPNLAHESVPFGRRTHEVRPRRPHPGRNLALNGTTRVSPPIVLLREVANVSVAPEDRSPPASGPNRKADAPQLTISLISIM